jgi:hypothetical protein
MSRERLEELRERLLREERVRQMVHARAYEIYQVRGGQPGFEAHDWFLAEGEVLAFLIAQESCLADEQPATESIPANSPSETPKPRDGKLRAASKRKDAKQSVQKKTAQKLVASKKRNPKSKTKRTSKSSRKDKTAKGV